MQTNYRSLSTSVCASKLILPNLRQTSDITLDYPALDLMDDFSVIQPVTLPDELCYHQIGEILRDAHTDYALVQNRWQQVLGLIVQSDIMGMSAMRRAHQYQQKLRDLTARDLMTPLSGFPSVSVAVVHKSRIGDILQTLEHHPAQYLLVNDEHMPNLQGVFSLRKLTQCLHVFTEPGLKAASFAEMAEAVFHDAR